MSGIEARLAKLEAAQHAEDAPQWSTVEFRPVPGGDLWQDSATGRVGTKDELSEQYPSPVVLVFLDSSTRIRYRG